MYLCLLLDGIDKRVLSQYFYVAVDFHRLKMIKLELYHVGILKKTYMDTTYNKTCFYGYNKYWRIFLNRFIISLRKKGLGFLTNFLNEWIEGDFKDKIQMFHLLYFTFVKDSIFYSIFNFQFSITKLIFRFTIISQLEWWNSFSSFCILYFGWCIVVGGSFYVYALQDIYSIFFYCKGFCFDIMWGIAFISYFIDNIYA